MYRHYRYDSLKLFLSVSQMILRLGISVLCAIINFFGVLIEFMVFFS